MHPAEWRQLSGEVRARALARRGIDLGEISLVLHVQERAGTLRLRDGTDHPRRAEAATVRAEAATTRQRLPPRGRGCNHAAEAATTRTAPTTPGGRRR